MAETEADATPAPSTLSPYHIAGQQVLSEPDVSPVEHSDDSLPALQRTLSDSTRRSGHYGAQRLEKRPTSAASAASRSSKGKGKGNGKRHNVDFRDPPTDDDERYRPISPVQPDSAGESSTRPSHSRDESYTNFSRPDPILRRDSSMKNSTNDAAANSGMTALPTHSEALAGRKQNPTSATSTARSSKSMKRPDDNQMSRLPEHSEAGESVRQHRMSATSTSGSRRLRPPVHQSDIERGDATSSEESAPAPPFAQSVDQGHMSGRRYKNIPPPPPNWLQELYTISYLIFFSFLGTLARTGLQWLTFYPGATIITPVVWANFAGSLFMGFMTEDFQIFKDEWAEPFATTPREEKRMSKQSRVSRQSRQSRQSRMSTLSQDFARFQRKERLNIKKKVPLYTGLTTGFCGCFTSFSAFARDMFLAISNDTPSAMYHPGATDFSTSSTVPRNGGYSFMAVVAVILITMALSIGGFVAGQQLAMILDNVTPRLPAKFTRLFLDKLIVILGFGCWLASVFLLIWPPDRPGGPLSAGSWANETWRGIELFSMAFAPVGCLLRYYASKYMNGLEPSFPMGTFAVNMLGTAIIAMCYDLQRISIGDGTDVGGGLLGCQALEGLMDGFTGSLTTVSTWVAEICALRRRYSWMYALSTISGGLCLVVAILGPVRWTVGWSDPACVTSYTNKY